MPLKKKIQIIIVYETEREYLDELEEIDRILTTKVPYYWEATVSLHIGEHITLKIPRKGEE